MNTWVIIGGSAVLVLLAIAIGLLSDRQSREQAWRRIATERRRNWENRQAITSIVRRCRVPDCPLRTFLDASSDDLE